MRRNQPLKLRQTVPSPLPLRTNNPVWLTLAVTLFHVGVMTVGFAILVAVFQFPDILRAPAEVRLQLFMENYAVVVPTYFWLALTGLSQAVVAVLLWLSAPKRDEPTLVLSALFGVLCGIFQSLGFIRWVIVIPYLADRMSHISTPSEANTITLLEGLINRYAGMALGEHLGSLTLGIWAVLLGLAILRQPFIDRRLGWVGYTLGLGAIAMALEPLGSWFTPLEHLVAGVFTALTTWLVLVAMNLVRLRHGNPAQLALPTWLWVAGVGYTLVMALPAYLF